MFGFLIFNHVYNNLGEKCRKKILRNVFGNFNVSVFQMFIRNNTIVFRFFEDGVFYQYLFEVCEVEESYRVKVVASRRIFNCLVRVGVKESLNRLDSFYLFINLLQCQDEYQVYQILRYLL